MKFTIQKGLIYQKKGTFAFMFYILEDFSDTAVQFSPEWLTIAQKFVQLYRLMKEFKIIIFRPYLNIK